MKTAVTYRSDAYVGTSPHTELAVPAHTLPQRSPLELLILARRGLSDAVDETHDGLRYATAHLAALRAAAAVLAARARPAHGRRSRPQNVWDLLAVVAPELREWADYFAYTAGKRAAAQAGVAHVVTAREADDLVRDADRFAVVVAEVLGLNLVPRQSPGAVLRTA